MDSVFGFDVADVDGNTTMLLRGDVDLIGFIPLK